MSASADDASGEAGTSNPSLLWGGVALKAPGWGCDEIRTMPHSAIAKQTRGRARSLRHAATDAERKLWYHFRRQAPVGVYIADFACHTAKLVIELDGSQHAEATKIYDAQRTAWLESQGYRVLRFWNNDVLKSPHNIGEAIIEAMRGCAAISKSPTPNPSPQGGGERAGARGEE
jgi:very-short-patch-repair endonuclease